MNQELDTALKYQMRSSHLFQQVTLGTHLNMFTFCLHNFAFLPFALLGAKFLYLDIFGLAIGIWLYTFQGIVFTKQTK